MPDASRLIPIVEATAESFAPYGQLIEPRHVMGQFINPNYQPWTNPNEAQLTLGTGRDTPRLWIMHLPRRGMSFTQMARHRRVTQCLGSLDGQPWFLAVAPAGDLSDAGRPGLEDIVGIRVPASTILKLGIGTWHAGPHFDQEGCTFLNLEHMDTRERDFHEVDLGVTCTMSDRADT
jgi:ureidoglycolate hydrolase